MKVELISWTNDPIKTAARACAICYNSEPSPRLVKQCIASGHLSTIEHINFTFEASGVSRACYDRETEVLTKEGWKHFCDVKVDEEVLTINQQTLQAEFQKVMNTISYKYSGLMHQYKSQNINLLVTPNHNMFIKKYDVRRPDHFHLIPSEEITNKRFYFMKKVNYKAPEIDDCIIIPGYSYKRKNNQGQEYVKELPDLRLDRKNFYKLLAWYISEGSVYYNKEENSYTISISQTKKDNIERILTIVQDCGFKPNYDGHAIKFKNLVLGKYLKDLGYSLDKKIPFNIFDSFDCELAQIFIEEYILGDGTTDSNGCSKIYTISKELSEQIYNLCYISGMTATVHIDNRVGQEHMLNGKIIRPNHPCYVINISSSGKRNYTPVVKKDKHFSVIPFNDYVYCVEVPNHTLFVRRNGIACWCGNCTHQLVRHRIASYSQQSQRYVSMEDAQFIYPGNVTGREFPIYDEAFQKSIESYKTLQEIGAKNEDARAVLPNACPTKIIFTMNLRSLGHFMNERLCSRAQQEIRKMALLMIEELKNSQSSMGLNDEEMDIILSLCVPKCEAGKIKFCPEHKSCNRYLTAKEINNLVTRKISSWIFDGDTYHCESCSAAYSLPFSPSNYCPECGSYMKFIVEE